MLGGVKFIPRDQIDKENNAIKDEKLGGSKGKHRKKSKSSRYGSSDDELERIKKRSRKKQKWYSSEEDFSSYSSESDGGSGQERRKQQKKKKKQRTRDSSSDEYDSSYSSGNESDRKNKHRKGSKRERKKGEGRGSKSDIATRDSSGSPSMKDIEIVRKEMGLEWMLRPQERPDKKPSAAVDNTCEEPPAEEATEMKVNPRELNPYLRNNGSGYPEDADNVKSGGDRLLSSSVVGDGGASWRLKALKRAQEQAAREGRKLEEVVEERWGSVGQLAVSAASRIAAAPRAHLHAIKSRKKGVEEGKNPIAEDGSERDIKKNGDRGYLRDVSSRHPEMRAPRVNESLSWGKRRSHNSTRDAGVITAAASSINKFSNDGNFMEQFFKKSDPDDSCNSLKEEASLRSELAPPDKKAHYTESTPLVEGLSANQLAAKALQLRMKGKHDEAEKLLKEAENLRMKLGAQDNSTQPVNEGSSRRYTVHDVSIQQKKKDDDVDLHLARTIVQNKKFSISGQADDEYDFDDGPRKKSRRKGGSDSQKVNPSISKRLLTQQERCLFCFENPNRPKHLVVSIANFTYLMLPKWQQVVPGHCCILPMQHESATRNIDNNVWDEIRNFKKCLIMMFSKQDKELVFLETVMGLTQQRRHCLIECIPLPREIAKEAPLYFKKAIDEAEDEWSQHNAKKLIDTSEKGLRGSIPKNFPYFHVEFGLSKGFVHVIDDEKQFNDSLGLNVIRGMLQLPEEDMYRRRRHESVDTQKEAVVSFAREWEPFDWTKQLG